MKSFPATQLFRLLTLLPLILVLAAMSLAAPTVAEPQQAQAPLEISR